MDPGQLPPPGQSKPPTALEPGSAEAEIRAAVAEQELRRALSLVKSTLESTADGILVVDNVGRIVSFNRKFASLWRIPQDVLDSRNDERALGHVLEQLVDPEAFLRRVRELYENPTAESFDTLDFKDGRVFERYSCSQQLDGAPVGRVWSFRDITERIRLEEQFRQAHKMEAVGQLASGVAHDFNNLLTIILGNLSLVRMIEPNAEQLSALLDECFRAAQRAAGLTEQLLMFSRQHPPKSADIDLNEVVEEMTKMLRRIIGEHITLVTRLAPEGAAVRADRGMMGQLLMNFTLNSRDAMPKGGRLLLATACVELTERADAPQARGRPGSYVCLSVTDTGTGIAPEHLARIFEPFFTTKEVGKGTGLGLATAFGIVEQHQGWIEVESAVGAGTTMRVYLPRVAGGGIAARDHSPPSAPPRGSETILLAEDEAEVLQLMTVILTSHGYRVHPAANAAEALKLWREKQAEIDLLMTDIVMPGDLGGRELAGLLKAAKPGLRVIYCSGYSNEMFVGESPLRANPNFLGKPFEVNTLLKLVRDCLDAPAK